MARGLFCLTALVIMVGIMGCGKTTSTDPVSPDTGPMPPAWVHVSATASNEITLRWDDITTTEAGYYIERASSAGGDFTQIDTLSNIEDGEDGFIEVYVDTSVVPGAKYYYRIRCWDSIGRNGEPSAPVVWATAEENQTPDTPIAVFPESNSGGYSGSMTLEWSCTDPDADEISYEVYFGNSRIDLENVASASAAVSYSINETLLLTYYYFWRIVARDPSGAMALSPIWNFGTTIERVEVPEGYFFQGDCGFYHEADPVLYCYENNPVYLTGFDIDKYEVTNQQYTQFLQLLLDMDSQPWIEVVDGLVSSRVGDTLFAAIYPDGDENSNISFNPDQGINGTFTPRAGKANHPVIEVTWAGARRFAHFYDRRLPSEAEWEKAAKGTTAVHGDSLFQIDEVDIVVGFGTLYPWGNDVSNAHFNFINSGDPDETRVGVGTTPVGFYNGSSSSGFSTISNESPFGAFDMAGNVSEWCEEDFVDYHSGSNEHLKVIKGGSWRRGANEATGFWRQMIEPDQTDNAIGFRTVKSLSP